MRATVCVAPARDFMFRSDKEEPLYKIWICVRGEILADRLLDSYGIFEDVTVVRADIWAEMEQIYKEISKRMTTVMLLSCFIQFCKAYFKIEQEIRAGRNAVGDANLLDS